MKRNDAGAPSGSGALGPAAAIGSVALEALLLEAAAEPKPGLVCPSSRGAHRDMDFLTFIASGSALAPWFVEFARLGAEGAAVDPAELLPPLREAGRGAERDMLRATGGVNTHKGLVFSLGILCASAGSLAAAERPLFAADCAKGAAAITNGIVARDFAGLASRDPSSLSAGERLYLRHGVAGVRAEAEAGFPDVLGGSLPRLEAGLASGLGMGAALVDALLELMASVDDTNVLARGGTQGLELLRARARSALERGGIASEEGRAAIGALGELCESRNLSPGGCADLLAVTAFLHLLPAAWPAARRRV